MAPAGQVWSTRRPTSRRTRVPARRAPRTCCPRRAGATAFTPQSGALSSGLGYAHGARLPAAPRRLRHAGRPHRLDARLPRHLLRRPAPAPGRRRVRQRHHGAARGRLAGDLLDDLEPSEPTVAPAWRPAAEVPAEIAEVLGVWHWGYTPYVFSAVNPATASSSSSARTAWSCTASPSGRPPRRASPATTPARRCTSYAAPDGSVSHLDMRTFIFTRTPYDPEVPVPGGHPGR